MEGFETGGTTIDSGFGAGGNGDRYSEGSGRSVISLWGFAAGWAVV